MTEKELALEAVWSEMEKVIRCNILTGEIVYIKNLPEEEAAGCHLAKTMDEHVRNVVASGLVHKMDVEGYLKHVELSFLRSEIEKKSGALVYSYRRKTGEGYQWFSYEALVPKNYSDENPWLVFLGKRADSDTCAMQDAMRMLSSIYHKIVRFNLKTDTYEIIKNYEEELNPEYGICACASEWFRNFALRGFVHEDDLEQYLLFTEFGALREHFDHSKESKKLRYRRFTQGEFRLVELEFVPAFCYSKEFPEILTFIKDIDA